MVYQVLTSLVTFNNFFHNFFNFLEKEIVIVHEFNSSSAKYIAFQKL